MKGDEAPGEKKMSKKARKLASRLTVAELKQLVRRPDVVEVEDVTASDPRLLVYLKSYRNTVPVPAPLVLQAPLPAGPPRHGEAAVQAAG